MTESPLALSLHPFRPRLLDALKSYKKADFLADLMSGITVGIVALPLAMAFAIASGLKPENGIFTAIVAGFIISALGGTKIQIGGPAGAFIIIVYGIVAHYGVDGLLIATIMAGVMLFALGLFKLGTLVRFVPVSIVIGFTNGIAVLIALSQVKDFLGLRTGELPADFFPRMGLLATHINTLDPVTVIIGLVSLGIVFGWSIMARHFPGPVQRRAAHIPGSIVALVTGTALTALLHLNIETIGTRFGDLPRSLPAPVVPHMDFAVLQHLFAPALTIALLGAVESLLCARVADSMTEDRHDPNQELMAQGLANIAAPLLGGYAATGTIARTVTNIRAGARSPISGMVHALTLLLIIMIAAPLARDIPLATLAAILLYVAYNMGQWHEFARMRHFAHSYKTILITTFLLTVIVDLTVAVEAGLMLACIFFIIRISNLTQVEPIPEVEGFPAQKYGDQVEAYRIFGSLFFGAADKLEALMNPSRKLPKVVILDLGAVLTIDATGLEALVTLHDFLDKRGSRLVLCHMPGGGRTIFKGPAAFLQDFGDAQLARTLPEALEKAEAFLNKEH